MKVKSITPLLTSLVLATAASFTVSAIAEQAATQAAPTMVSPEPANVGQSNSSMPGSASVPQNSSMPNVGAPAPSDDVTPDTATGDDDY